MSVLVVLYLVEKSVQRHTPIKRLVPIQGPPLARTHGGINFDEYRTEKMAAAALVVRVGSFQVSSVRLSDSPPSSDTQTPWMILYCVQTVNKARQTFTSISVQQL